MSEILAAVLAGATAAELEDCPLPETYLAAFTRSEDAVAGRDAPVDVRSTINVDQVPMPAIAPDEVLLVVMASAVNHNTVWSATFKPVSTFVFLRSLGRLGGWASRHDQPYHVLGSDAAGIIVRVGLAVRRWRVGDNVVVAPAYIDHEDSQSQDDGMLASDQRAWGFETNFGGLAQFAVVKATQLLPKARHLSWEEAACNTLCASTAYRMLVGPRGGRLKQGDVVLIWGATGGLGSYAVQFVRNGGGIAVGIVGSPEREAIARGLGYDAVIQRAEFDEIDRTDPLMPDAWRRLGRAIRREVGEDPHIVFEHVGRHTFGASLYVLRRGGVLVTCGSGSGYMHEFDNRHLWMRLKRVVGSHGANYQEAWESNRLLTLGRIFPALSLVYPLSNVADAVRLVELNQHVGKIGVLCVAPQQGLGVEDIQLRANIGAGRFNLLNVS